MLSEYQGPKLKNVKVETHLFDGLKFSMYTGLLYCTEGQLVDVEITVVSSDPKSKTGDKDKKDLITLWVFCRYVKDLTHVWYRIHANGGTCAQIATNQPQLFVVYGGKTIRMFPSSIS